MIEPREGEVGITQRERELELEVGRLKAEVETLRGEDPTVATSRFLAMAAATVDLAVADARREADEIAEEISGEAEARRDEATRVAAEAEAMAEQMLAEADVAQEVIDEAAQEAASIRIAAEAEATKIVAVERERVGVEVAALAEVRETLENERVGLEAYHEELRRRVQELAESMMGFMTTEAPLDSVAPLENAALPLLNAAPMSGRAETDAPAGEVVDDDHGPDEETLDGVDMSADLEVEFGGVPVIDDPHARNGAVDVRTSSASLFSRTNADKVAFEDLAAGDEDRDDPALFSQFGERLIKQTSGALLAEALESDDPADAAFREFLEGDNEPDPSRDWLLRDEKS